MSLDARHASANAVYPAREVAGVASDVQDRTPLPLKRLFHHLPSMIIAVRRPIVKKGMRDRLV